MLSSPPGRCRREAEETSPVHHVTQHRLPNIRPNESEMESRTSISILAGQECNLPNNATASNNYCSIDNNASAKNTETNTKQASIVSPPRINEAGTESRTSITISTGGECCSLSHHVVPFPSFPAILGTTEDITNGAGLFTHQLASLRAMIRVKNKNTSFGALRGGILGDAPGVSVCLIQLFRWTQNNVSI